MCTYKSMCTDRSDMAHSPILKMQHIQAILTVINGEECSRTGNIQHDKGY